MTRVRRMSRSLPQEAVTITPDGHRVWHDNIEGARLYAEARQGVPRVHVLDPRYLPLVDASEDEAFEQAESLMIEWTQRVASMRSSAPDPLLQLTQEERDAIAALALDLGDGQEHSARALAVAALRRIAGWSADPARALREERVGKLRELLVRELRRWRAGDQWRLRGTHVGRALDDLDREEGVSQDGMSSGDLVERARAEINRARAEADRVYVRLDGAPVFRCTRPPAGWQCTRRIGHDGPCAAVPVPPTTSED